MAGSTSYAGRVMSESRLRLILRHAFDLEQCEALPGRPEKRVESPFTLAADDRTSVVDPGPPWLCRLCVTLGTWTLVGLFAGFLLTFIVAPVVHVPLNESPLFPLGLVLLGAGVLGGVSLCGLALLGRVLAHDAD